MSKIKKKSNTTNPNSFFTISKWYGLAVFILAFFIYANTLSHDYCLDDYSVIKENRHVKKGLSSTPTLLKTHYRDGYWNNKGTLYRPLSLVMFAAEWNFAPDNPSVGHFVNVLFFAWTGWLLFQLLALLFHRRDYWLPLFISLLFVAHPIHTEVVANIKSRDEIMAFFLGLAGLYYLIQHIDTRKRFPLALSLVFYGFSLFSKESAITWVAIYPLTIFYFRNPKPRQLLITSSLFLIPTGIFLFIRSNILGKMASVQPDIVDNFFTRTGDISTTEYFGSALYMIFEYLKALVLPLGLVSDKGYNQIPIKNLTSIGSVFVMLLLIGSIFYIYKAFLKNNISQKIIVFGLLFFGLSFSIYSNLFIEIGSSYGERFLYMPSLGFAMILGGGLYSFVNKTIENNKVRFFNPAFLILLTLTIFYSTLTIKRNKAWKNSSTLYKTDILLSPNSAKLNYHHGLELGKNASKLSGQAQVNQYNKALSYFEKAIAIHPDYSDPYAQLGLNYFRLKKYNKALSAYQKAVKIKPNANAYSNMGIIFFQRKDIKNAERVYKLALKYEPSFIDAHRNLGAVYATTQRYELAIEQFKKGLKYDPTNQVLLKYIGSAYRDLGKPELGQPYLKRLENK